MAAVKKSLEFTADIFNKVITFIIVIQFFRGEEIGIIQLTVIVIGLLLDLIAKIY